MNLTDLKKAVEDYTLRTDLPFDTLLKLAEGDLAPQVVHWRGEVTEEREMNGDKTVDIPPYFVEGRMMKFKGHDVNPVSIFNAKSKPGEYSYYRVGDQFQLLFDGETGNNPKVTLTYFTRIPALNAQVPTNWLSEHFPQVYLSALLVRAYHYLRDEEAKASEQKELGAAITALVADGKNGQKAFGELKVGGSNW